MATTLTELFTDIADSIRRKKGISSSGALIPAAEFAAYISSISPSGSTEVNSAFVQNLLNPVKRTVAASITIKAATIYDGYIFAIGNDSNGDAYKLYGTVAGNLKSVKLGNSRFYPATCIECDGTHVWIGNGSGAYRNRVLLRQTVAEFKSTSTSLGTFANTAMHHTCSCRATGYSFFFGGTNDGKNGAYSKVANGSSSATTGQITTSIPEPFVSCTNGINGSVVAVTEGGYVAVFDDPSKTTYRYKKHDFLKGAKFCGMAVTTTYIVTLNTSSSINIYMPSKTVGDGLLDAKSYNYININVKASEILGVTSKGNYLVITYLTEDGEIKNYFCSLAAFWAGMGAGAHGFPINISNGFNLRKTLSDANNLYVLSDNGSTVEKAVIPTG